MPSAPWFPSFPRPSHGTALVCAQALPTQVRQCTSVGGTGKLFIFSLGTHGYLLRELLNTGNGVPLAFLKERRGVIGAVLPKVLVKAGGRLSGLRRTWHVCGTSRSKTRVEVSVQGVGMVQSAWVRQSRRIDSTQRLRAREK